MLASFSYLIKPRLQRAKRKTDKLSNTTTTCYVRKIYDLLVYLHADIVPENI